MARLLPVGRVTGRKFVLADAPRTCEKDASNSGGDRVVDGGVAVANLRFDVDTTGYGPAVGVHAVPLDICELVAGGEHPGGRAALDAKCSRNPFRSSPVVPIANLEVELMGVVAGETDIRARARVHEVEGRARDRNAFDQLAVLGVDDRPLFRTGSLTGSSGGGSGSSSESSSSSKLFSGGASASGGVAQGKLQS